MGEPVQFRTLKNLLVSVFSVETGLSEAAESAALESFLSNLEVRERLRNDLAAFIASGLSWKELLDNPGCCVYPAESEQEARQFVMDKFGTRLLSE